MKRLLRYTAWNWSMSRVPAGLLLAVGAAVECVLLCAAAAMPYLAGAVYNELVLSSGILWVVALEYLCIPVFAQFHQLFPGKGTRVSDTVMTLPIRRWQLPVGRMLATALWLLLGMAVQVLVLLVMWGPVTALQQSVAAGYFQFDVTARGSAWWALSGCGLLRLLLPTEGADLMLVALLVLLPSVLIPTVSVLRGRKRLVAVMLVLAEQFCVMYLALAVVAGNLAVSQLGTAFFRKTIYLAGGVIMFCGAVALLLWGLRAWYRCETAA